MFCGQMSLIVLPDTDAFHLISKWIQSTTNHQSDLSVTMGIQRL